MKILTYLICLFICCSANANSKSTAFVRFIKGKAIILREQKEITIVKDMEVTEKDIIKTSKKSFVLIKFPDAVSIKIDSRSKVKLESFKKDFHVKIEKGSSFFKIDKKRENPFKVETRSMSLAVRGTTFFTSHDLGSQRSWTCVKEGVVDIISIDGKEKIELNQGLGISADKDHGISTPSLLQWTKNLNWSFNESEDSLNKVGTDVIQNSYHHIDYE